LAEATSALYADWAAGYVAGGEADICAGVCDSCETDLQTCDGDLTTCQGDLVTCETNALCGNGVLDVGEDCDFGDLNGGTCTTLGLLGEGLVCTPGTCAFDTSACAAARYEDTGLGTVIDHVTGLEWEKKTAENVDDVYQWDAAFVYVHGVSAEVGAPPGGSVQGLGGQSDWRLPSHTELQTLLIEAFPCGTSPCIDPIFGPTALLAHWAATTATSASGEAWAVAFGTGFVNFAPKTFGNHVRAVRSVL
jgi:hypothetical protein